MPKSGVTITKDVAEGVLTTGVAAEGGGLMAPEQAQDFIDQLFDTTDLTKAVRHENRERPTGSIQKMLIQHRIMRPKFEAEWDGHLTSPTFSQVQYECKQSRVDAEVSEDFYRRNIGKESTEGRIMKYIAKQIAVDREDLMLNGDTSLELPAGATEQQKKDHVFLTMNDGWVKQIKENGHVLQATGADATAFNLNMFYKIERSIPNKYLTEDFKWIMSPSTAKGWQAWMLTQAATAGGIVTEYAIKNPAGYGFITSNCLEDGVILFCDPKNLIMVTTYDIIWKKTVQSTNAIRRDVREYSTFVETDAIMEEADATAIYLGFNPFSDEAVGAAA